MYKVFESEKDNQILSVLWNLIIMSYISLPEFYMYCYLSS